MKISGFRTWVAAALLVACSAANADAVGRSLCNGFPNGILDGEEECETGDCCTVRCELAKASTVCGESGSDPICDPTGVCGELAPVAHAACPDLSPPDGTPCDDDLFCTSGETCNDGECGGDPEPTCDDDNSCTVDSCNENQNTCENDPVGDGNPCDDGNACTTGGQCDGGECIGDQVVVCNDNNDCTDDTCQPGPGCVFTNNDDPCSDGLFCTGDDVCANGICAGVAIDCGDGNICTTDSCNETTDMCDHLDNTVECDDLTFCTENDQCSGGVCAGVPRSCSDGNPCTDDVCNEDLGECLNPNNSLPCSDGLFCSDGDTCSGGVCVAGPARNCADTSACTTDTCDEEADECDHANIPGECDDGLHCTENDACTDGLCTGTLRVCNDDNPCTSDACNEQDDQCDFLANALACDDGIFCNGADTCAGSSCSVHDGDPCDGADGDGNCSESCDEQTEGCTAADPDLSPCSDDDICTIGDFCDDGICESGETDNPVCATTTTEAPTTTTIEVTTTTVEITTTTVEVTTTTLFVTTTTEPEDPVCGDFNGDGTLTAGDALGALRAAVGAVSCPLSVCDFTGDGLLTSTDALAILRASIGLSNDPDCPEAA